MTIPGGKMKLVDRVVHLESRGGRFGLGCIQAEADIHPDAWFLTCHFIDDQVMPGTLMYECCLHTLRIFLLRMGWVADAEGAVYEPVPGVISRLKCRGQVLATTAKVTYEVSIKELGYRPEPYVLVDALMYADNKPIVEITDMSLQLSGMTRDKIRAIWQQSPASEQKPAIFDRDRILAFAIGNPSEAFGEPYRIFDEKRGIARLPGPAVFVHRPHHGDSGGALENGRWRYCRGPIRRVRPMPGISPPIARSTCRLLCCWRSPCSPAAGWLATSAPP